MPPPAGRALPDQRNRRRGAGASSAEAAEDTVAYCKETPRWSESLQPTRGGHGALEHRGVMVLSVRLDSSLNAAAMTARAARRRPRQASHPAWAKVVPCPVLALYRPWHATRQVSLEAR